MRWARSPWRRGRGRIAGASLACGLGCVVATVTTGARADGVVDATYGRIDGDVTLGVGAGAVVAARGVRAEGELRARYLDSVGVFGAYEDGFGSAAEPTRVLATGLELRPLFLARWLQGLEVRRARTDLALDSFGLELAATFSQASGASFGSTPGIQVGLGLELPIAPDATGPWLAIHGGLRWSDHALASGTAASADDRSAYLTLTIAWHQTIATHLVDVGDRAPR